ncbi:MULTISPECIES: glycosyltransferase family 4 protein [unclassified Moorena]|uniref:MraY family glycosyltransferase n=1 Tax=unclassified Moorena TaxID=2683338 RepID=UPI0013FEFB6C|nr:MULTISPECIES: glycosyltransferase family 4 protein [unclassified Moorena]NEO11019.1 glycosyltransferase family 4 protein [Moorena sp. SIO3E8]NEP99133.1 glycosyltransferase family 4 protein [Moorena sp. SIO3F7]
MHPLLTLCVISFSLSLLSVALIKQNLSQQLIDIPKERSSHSQPTPRGGGLGFIIAFAIAIIASQFLGLNLIDSGQNTLWFALIPLVIIGIIDDWRGVPASVRYLVQFSVATVVVASCGAFPFPGLAHLGIAGELIATLLTIIAMTALINFYNFMDGLDGLVGGVTAVQLGFFALWLNQPLLWLLVAALGGFLYWNWSPAKIFMGDVGSTFLGAVVAITLLSQNHNPASAWSALAFTLPLIGDAIYTLCRRLLRGENIFKAHRSNLYQRLEKSGWSHSQVAITYICITLLMAFSIDFLRTIGAWSSLASVIVAIACAETYLRRCMLSST